MNIEDLVKIICRDSAFWAPETRAAKLAEYLNSYGEPLYDALKLLPDDARESCGIDKIRRVER